MKFNLTPKQLKEAERSVYSQGGQDGILEAIFNQIGIDHYCCMEFGARDGFDLSNTANLAVNKNFRRILIDAEPKSHRVLKAFITKENINEITSPYMLDYLSIDMDGNDYWVWQAIENKPRVVSIEYNSKFRNDISVAIEYNENHRWQADDYYGASLLAMKKLGNAKGYALVYRVGNLDAFFVREDLIDENYTPPTLDELFPKPIISFDKVSNKKWVEV